VAKQNFCLTYAQSDRGDNDANSPFEAKPLLGSDPCIKPNIVYGSDTIDAMGVVQTTWKDITIHVVALRIDPGKRPAGLQFGQLLGGAGIVETSRFLAERVPANFATQSGPMLVIDRAIHPAFIVGSSDRKPRNGVGVSSGTRVHFVISRGWVNFHEFARFFRDGLGCKNALFLDGGMASGLYAPKLGRNDAPGHGGYGPIIAVID
jgi:hypothetical protein